MALLALVLAGAVIGAVAGLRHVYFVGQDHGLVTLYRGVRRAAVRDQPLREPVRQLGAGARLTPVERRRLLDHQLRSRNDAADLIRRLEESRQ